MATEAPTGAAEQQADSGDASQQGSEVRGSNYEIIRKRLADQANKLRSKADELNNQRKDLFGGTELTVVGQDTIRTENNCIPQDIVNIGGRLLFGYNVYVGMRSETTVDDVFSLHAFERDGVENGDTGSASFSIEPLPEQNDENFLGDRQFNEDFKNLYTYYDDVRLRALSKTETRLLAIFQTGTTLEDIRVLRWGRDPAGGIDYIDNTGEKDHQPPPSHDFKWTAVTRSDHIMGRHPHVSIKDKVFVETVGGDLTIKIEDNTEDGKGIYAEPVDDRHQSLGDAEIFYHEIGNLILLKIQPYREEDWRYFVFNTLTQKVERIDAIGQSCISLPEDHGVIYPGGYALSDGQSRSFDTKAEGLQFRERVRSPNGEDVLYVFYRPSDGNYLLLSYNVIRKDVANPITCHGYSVFRDGTMIVFSFTGDEPTRVHPMQIWQTPYHSDEYAAEQPTDDSLMANLGNAELVNAISDILSVARMVDDLEPTVAVYEALIKEAQRLTDNYFWLDKDELGDETGNIAALVDELVETANLVVDEFRKVSELKKKAKKKLEEAEEKQDDILADVRYGDWQELERFVEGLSSLRQQRGKLITLKDTRYIDKEKIDELEQEVADQFDELSKATVEFLLGGDALTPYREKLDELAKKTKTVENTKKGEELGEQLDKVNKQLTLLTDVLSNLQIDDPQKRTEILESIGEVLSRQNQTRARLDNKIDSLREEEGKAEFAVQFQLFNQTMNSALGMVETPEDCDEQLTRLMTQLEELESRFSEFDTYLAKLAEKREDVYEVFESRKQQLLEERNRRANNITQAAERILEGVVRRAGNMESVEDLNAYFASDAMIMKVRDQIENLRELGEDVKADDIQTQLKSAKDQAIRQVRDKVDLFEGGDNVIKFGRHRFSVNTQDAEMTMVPRDEGMALHITGTDFFQQVDDPEFNKTKEFWDQPLVSETDEVYRAEYLAATILFKAEDGASDFDHSVRDLHEMTLEDEGLKPLIKKEINERYDEGYERGVHDADGRAILEAVLGVYTTAGLLRYTPESRAIACIFWAGGGREEMRQQWARRGVSLGRLRETFDHEQPLQGLGEELGEAIFEFAEARDLYREPRETEKGHVGRFTKARCREAGKYLAQELVDDRPRFVAGSDAKDLRDDFKKKLDSRGNRMAFEEDLRELTNGDESDLGAAYDLVEAWLEGYAEREYSGEGEEGGDGVEEVAHIIPETAALLLTEQTSELDREETSARTTVQVKELLGQHPRIENESLEIRLDEFMNRLRHYAEEHVPAWREYRKLSHKILERSRQELKVDDMEPEVLSTFVRNELIDEVYLQLVGDNLAKQMGTAGEDTRSDRSGLLFLISPPGYGKTVLMEYLADRLGVMFMKINGPSLGHEVTSLDPEEAPNATARQEVQKINLALEMGNNVILYCDDIQHTHPEFLQKFISLCDSTRQIEGVWNGETKTYDLRGKRFAVVMAGNPYTESGERFQIPDMLANRADTYNLGDILEGNRDAFEKSYIENALTSNDVTAPLVTRDDEDIDRFLRIADGEQIPMTEMSYDYSSVEANEIVEVLKKMMRIRDVVLKVNQQYIESAAQKDEYRTEPPFQLQGSYRNMNKMAEKVASAMNDDEVEQLIDNHYKNEAQTLTTGAEQNLLKLKELRGTLSDEEARRWDEIKREFKRRKMMGGGDDDPVSRVAGPLSTLVQRLEDVHGALDNQDQLSGHLGGIKQQLKSVRASLDNSTKQNGLSEHLGGIKDHLANLQTSLADAQNRDADTDNSAESEVSNHLGAMRKALNVVARRLQNLDGRLEEQAEQAELAKSGKSGQQTVVSSGENGEIAASEAEALSNALNSLRQAQLEVQVVGEMPQKVQEMLETQLGLIESAIVPLAKAVHKHFEEREEMEGKLDEALRHLQDVRKS